MEIENNVEMKPEPETKKPKRTKKEKIEKPAQGLIDAIEFLKPAQKKQGSTLQTHCIINNGWAVASNEVLTIGTKIAEDLSACPHSLLLLSALKKTGQDLAITQLSTSAISVKSGFLVANVPCVEFHQLAINSPDNPSVDISDVLKTGLGIVSQFATEGANAADLASVLIQKNTVVCTNRQAVSEFWHGFELPKMMLPKQAAVAVSKTKKELTKLGFGENSLTFWFADGSFISSRLYDEKYPEYLQVLESDWSKAKPIPENFFKALQTIKDFAKMGFVYFKNGTIYSNEIENEASSFIVEGLPEPMSFSAKLLLTMRKDHTTVNFDQETNIAYFFGDRLRSAVAGLKMKEEPEELSDEVKARIEKAKGEYESEAPF